MPLTEAVIDVLPPQRFAEVLPGEAQHRFETAMARGAEALRGRTMWHVNTVLKGGGVAEMLSSLLPYVRGAGIDCRWVAIDADPVFLAITKRLHNLLHGFDGDGGELGPAEERQYAATLARNAAELVPQVRAGDVVFVHDPQAAGLIPALVQRGASVIWHCHIGADEPNDNVAAAWRFLRPSVAPAHRYIFSRARYHWAGLDEQRLRVIQPSIDAFAPKNQRLGPGTVASVLHACGIFNGRGATPARTAQFVGADGTPRSVRRRVSWLGGGSAPPADAPIVLQSARWDRLKDPTGVIALFVDHLAEACPRTHLVLAGPSADGVVDDPEGAQVVGECVARRAAAPADVRERIHLASTPMSDEDETSVIVNALQRRADVLVQKSLAEGFGLVVAEAMWKERPVVSARVGGIQDQIENGVNGVLVDDPADDAAFAAAVAELLADPDRAAELGARAHLRVREHFLAPRQLSQTMDLVLEL